MANDSYRQSEHIEPPVGIFLEGNGKSFYGKGNQ